MKKIASTTHVFLWDLHEVILEKNLCHWLIMCLKFDKKWQLIKALNRKSIIIMITFLLERIGLINKQMVSEELIVAAQQTNNRALVELVTHMCSAYSPIYETVQLLRELSLLGYRHHLVSNIGKTVYDDCIVKFADIFSLFHGYSIPFVSNHNTIIKKPDPYFFTAHLNKYGLMPDRVIFIDDKLINVLAARSVGMHAIQFKNAEELRKILTKIVDGLTPIRP